MVFVFFLFFFFFFFVDHIFSREKMAVNSYILTLFWRVDFAASFILVCLCKETVIVSITSQVLLTVSSGLSEL